MTTIDRIEELLAKKGISRSRMMKDLGFSSGLFSQWKSGFQQPSLKRLMAIADYLGVSLDYLLGEETHTIAATKEEMLIGLFNGVDGYAELSTEQRNEILKGLEPTFEHLIELEIAKRRKKE